MPNVFSVNDDDDNNNDQTNGESTKKENLPNRGLCYPGRLLKLKEREKRDKNLDLARELKNLRNRKMTVIPIVIGALGSIPEELVKGLKELEIRGTS